jgi:hypothetical protein
LPFLVTLPLTRSYGIFTPEKLQDFYNIPRGEKSPKMCKNHHPRATPESLLDADLR